MSAGSWSAGGSVSRCTGVGREVRRHGLGVLLVAPHAASAHEAAISAASRRERIVRRTYSPMTLPRISFITSSVPPPIGPEPRVARHALDLVLAHVARAAVQLQARRR